MLNLSEDPCFPMEMIKWMTDPDSQRPKRMPQFYFQELADKTASRRKSVKLKFALA
jgi:hypothetical protein